MNKKNNNNKYILIPYSAAAGVSASPVTVFVFCLSVYYYKQFFFLFSVKSKVYRIKNTTAMFGDNVLTMEKKSR